MKIQKEETQLVGKWLYSGEDVSEDETAKRINWLIENHLVLISTDESGWNVLYKDIDDGRYWELSYPSSEMNGGGAPMLTFLFEQDAINKYSFGSSL